MKTVRVRIAVAVNEDGEWSACGWNDAKDAEKLDDAKAYFGVTDSTAYFIEADLPIPEPKTVQGEVVK